MFDLLSRIRPACDRIALLLKTFDEIRVKKLIVRTGRNTGLGKLRKLIERMTYYGKV